ncbi:MAG TPA: riboflavin synthase [Caulobacterales bacterium]|nr:riboflavin synthase [Caulobacterales bacterium]
MFTGIVTAVGKVVGLERRPALLRATIDSAYDPTGVAIGASISHDGCCLTVVSAERHGGGMRHVVEIAAESLAKTTLANWREGEEVNLERSLRAGDELGGHLVQGHVDGVGELLSRREEGDGARLRFSAPADLMPLIAHKGAITVNGVSLTVNEVEDRAFGVMIIPHTLAVTNLGKLEIGDKVNLEADTLARYAARILSARS